ncbi:MAG: HEAT repeat domain-containing protein [Endomicrobia bacterium]|nr:HEAT repeat domain-containing protein [Endomicrobiia bacterium]MCL2506565.1 HEAT repeat domain-containing protein [Endomicrobiia bacterium]MCL2506598.1 HEAT repeat domain-containing protein [Endomicrobiia bacterium]
MKNFLLSVFAFALIFSGCSTDGSNGTDTAIGVVGGMAAGSTTLNYLLGQLNSDNALVRMGAIQGIAKLGASGAQAVPALLPFLASPDANVRSNAAFALGQIGPKANAAIPDLITMLGDKDAKAQRTAVEAIANIGGANVPSLLIPLLISVNPTTQSSAMELLGNYGPAASAAIPTLISLVKGNKNARDLAFDTLIKIGPDSIAPITALLAFSDGDVVTKAVKALSLLK